MSSTGNPNDFQNTSKHGLNERVPAKLNTFCQLGHDGRTLWGIVLKFDRCRECVFLLLHELKDFLDRRVALTPGHVRSVTNLAVLQMHAGDPCVVFLDERDRALARAGDVMANVDVRAVVFRLAEGLVPEGEMGLG